MKTTGLTSEEALDWANKNRDRGLRDRFGREVLISKDGRVICGGATFSMAFWSDNGPFSIVETEEEKTEKLKEWSKEALSELKHFHRSTQIFRSPVQRLIDSYPGEK